MLPPVADEYSLREPLRALAGWLVLTGPLSCIGMARRQFVTHPPATCVPSVPQLCTQLPEEGMSCLQLGRWKD